jgi:hypothetical protein
MASRIYEVLFYNMLQDIQEDQIQEDQVDIIQANVDVGEVYGL